MCTFLIIADLPNQRLVVSLARNRGSKQNAFTPALLKRGVDKYLLINVTLRDLGAHWRAHGRKSIIIMFKKIKLVITLLCSRGHCCPLRRIPFPNFRIRFLINCGEFLASNNYQQFPIHFSTAQVSNTSNFCCHFPTVFLLCYQPTSCTFHCSTLLA